MAVVEVERQPHRVASYGRREEVDGQHEKDRYKRAQAELETWFAARDAILGLHGVGFHGSGQTVWDEVRIHWAHIAPRLDKHRAEMWELAEMQPTLRIFEADHPEEWGAAFVTLSPRSWPTMVARELSRGGRGGSLVALVLDGRELRKVWHEREETRREHAVRELMKAAEYEQAIDLALRRVDVSTLELLALLRAEARNVKAESLKAGTAETPDAELPEDRARKARFFRELRKEAESRFQASLKVYDKLMKARKTGPIS